MNAEVRELPLFPLNAVLFPGGPLPLRIFEPRYLDMVSRCMREQTGFAVVLLGEGEEASAVTSFAATGTEARIVDFDRLEGGYLGISCIGRERVRVVEAWREADGLNRGRVLDIAADPVVAVPPDQAWMKEVVMQVLPGAEDSYRHIEQRDDAAWIANRLAELLPLTLADKQTLLELQDPLERLAALEHFSHPLPVLDSFVTLVIVGLLLALVRRRTGAIAAGVGLHMGWVLVIKTTITTTRVNDDAPTAFLVGSYDGYTGWLVAGWAAILIAIAWSRGWLRPAR